MYTYVWRVRLWLWIVKMNSKMIIISHQCDSVFDVAATHREYVLPFSDDPNSATQSFPNSLTIIFSVSLLPCTLLCHVPMYRFGWHRVTHLYSYSYYIFFFVLFFLFILNIPHNHLDQTRFRNIESNCFFFLFLNSFLIWCFFSSQW